MKINFNKIPENILVDNNISKFNNVSEIFDFIYDEDWTKDEIINQLSDEMKKQLVLRNDNVRFDGDKFYYGPDMYEFENELQKGKIEGCNIDLNDNDIKKSVEGILSMAMGIPVTIGDENIDQIQKEMGNLGVEIYDRYYSWYSENGVYEINDYIDAFCYGKINDIKEMLDEIIDFTKKDKGLNEDEKIKTIKQVELYKEFLGEGEIIEDEEERD